MKSKLNNINHIINPLIKKTSCSKSIFKIITKEKPCEFH